VNSPLYPIIGNWYRAANQQLFEVVALDEADNLIEIQFYEGDIDEMDMETWNSMEIENAPPPEDWSGAYDNEDDDEIDYSEFPPGQRGSRVSLEDLE